MTWSRTSSNRLRRKPSSFTCRSMKRSSMILASCSASLRSKAVTRATIRVMRSSLTKSNGRKKTREGSGRSTILVRDARMDIAAKLSANYTLADVFKQLFHLAREAQGEDASAVSRLYRQLVSTVVPDKHVDVLKEQLAEIRSDPHNFLWILRQ